MTSGWMGNPRTLGIDVRLPSSVALSVALAIGVAAGPRTMPDDTAADAEDEIAAACEADVPADEGDPLLVADDAILAAADEVGAVVVGSSWRG